MKKQFITCIALLACVMIMPIQTWAQEPTTNWKDYTDTNWYDSASNSFTISTAAQLAGLAKMVNEGKDTFAGKTIVMAADIDLGAHLWKPIGTDYTRSFQGIFDGGGKVITNLKINRDTSFTGLFGYVMGTIFQNAAIFNLGIDSGSVKGNTVVGGVIGYAYSYVTLTNCYNNAQVSGVQDVGGLTGQATDYITLTNCYNGAQVLGDNNVGGLAGQATDHITLTDCYWYNSPDYKATGNNYEPSTNCFSFDDKGTLQNGTSLINALNSKVSWENVRLYSWRIPNSETFPVFAETKENADDSWHTSTGTYYEISSAAQLAGLAKIVNEGRDTFAGDTIVLIADIDLLLRPWTPIGTSNIRSFRGAFDGNKHKILNLNVGGYNYAGLFGVIAANASISNLGIASGSVGGSRYVGGLAGEANHATFAYCYNSAKVWGEYDVGGLVGNITSSVTFTNCYNSAQVSGIKRVGGLVGKSSLTSFINCYNSAQVLGTESMGGLIGKTSNTFFNNCYWLAANETSSIPAVGNTTTSVGCFSFDSNGKLTGKETTLVDALNYGIPWGGTTRKWATPNENESNYPTSWTDEQIEYFDLSWYNSSTNATFTIKSAMELAGLAKLVNDGIDNFSDKTITLTADIDLGAHPWTPIGENANTPFKGTFDGNTHKIFNLNINKLNDQIGLFGNVVGEGVNKKASISNLGIASGNVAGARYVGALAGTVHSNTTLTNCYNSAKVSGIERVGGLVGSVYNNTTFTNCYNNAQVSASGIVGGLVGSAAYVTLVNCYNSAQILGSSDSNNDVGGLMGLSITTSAILSNCYWIESTPKAVGNLYLSTDCSSFDSNGYLTDTKTTLVNALNNGMPWGFEAYKWATPDEKEGNFPVSWTNELTTLFDLSWYSKDGSNFSIKSATELAGLAKLVNEGRDTFARDTITLIADIDLEGHLWIPIATNEIHYFQGTFEGNKHKIFNLNVNVSTNYVGLFGHIIGVDDNNKASISNLGIASGSVEGIDNVGGLVGVAGAFGTSSSFTNCYNNAQVSGNKHVGGLIGNVSYAELNDCYNSAQVSGYSSIGGLAGDVTYTNLTNCYNIAQVSGTYALIGGLVGQVHSDVTLTNCYNNAHISGVVYIGGLVGVVESNSSLTNCYNIAQVSGMDHSVGGLTGAIYSNNTITNCHWLAPSSQEFINNYSATYNACVSYISQQSKATFDATSVTLYGAWTVEDLSKLSTLFTNPNCLWFIPIVEATIPADYTYNDGHFIKEMTIDNWLAQSDITLIDGYDFNTPHEFSMGNYTISYTRDWTLAKHDNGNNRYNWNTLTLPFSGQVYVDDTPVSPFTSDIDTGGSYWLKRFEIAEKDTDGETILVKFMHEAKGSNIQAHIPYIIALPSEGFDDASDVKNKTITIKGTGIISATPTDWNITDSNIIPTICQYMGNYASIDKVDIFRLPDNNSDNTTQETFVKVEKEDNIPALKPFRAYFKSQSDIANQAQRLVIANGDGSSSNISLPTIDEEDTETNKPRKVMTKEGLRIIVGDKMYTVDGRLVEKRKM